MKTTARIATGLAATTALLVLVPGTAWAHHAIFDFEADGAGVPDGDPDGTVLGFVDFNSEESPEMCITADAVGLGEITSVRIENIADQTLLVDFGTTLEGCIVTTDEQRDAMHDGADLYRIVVWTEDFPEGAVAGTFQERPPTTTTSSSTPTSVSPSSSASTSPTTAPTVVARPTFTG